MFHRSEIYNSDTDKGSKIKQNQINGDNSTETETK